MEKTWSRRKKIGEIIEKWWKSTTFHLADGI
jgi:hypothetical protein